MSKLSKAEDFYLRGYNSQFIKRRTGISTQSLLKQLLSNGIKYTKDDITNYQIHYILKKYSEQDIINAYTKMSKKHMNLEVAAHKKEIIILGCCFGNYAKVFKAILGEEKYKELRNTCWKRKQTKTVKERYGVDNVFDKSTFDLFVTPDAVANGRIKRTETMIERYGVEQPNQNPEICERMLSSMEKTMIERYGVAHIMQCPEYAEKVTKKRQKTMLEKYGVKNSVQSDKIRNDIFESRRKNGTLNSSTPEEFLYQMLIDKFGEDDVIRNKIIDNRYPFHVDFYIKSRDLFIELNGDKCHYEHWFDENNEQDRQVLQSWSENDKRISEATGKKSRYGKYIKTWSKTDVEKRTYAKKNNLNYLVFWDGSSKQKNKHRVPCLIDANAWFADGCPNPSEWHKENTY
jgi:hypothetical protein